MGSIRRRWLPVFLLVLAQLSPLLQAQSLQWIAHGPGGDGVASSLPDRRPAMDAGGNLYVAATAANGTGSDLLTEKYAPDGSLLWRVRERSASGQALWSLGVAVNAAGDVVSAGVSASGDAITLHGYSAAGERRWTRIHPRDPLRPQERYWQIGFRLDGAGNIYLSANADGYIEPTFFHLIKYDRDGILQWNRSIRDAEFPVERIYADAFTLDAGGTPLLCATRTRNFGTAQAASRIAVMKFDAAGNPIWERNPGNAVDASCRQIVTDAAGNVLTSGIAAGQRQTAKHDASGSLQWLVTLAGNVGDDEAAMQVDAAGNLLMIHNDTSTTARLVKYATATGAMDWSRSWPGLDAASSAFAVDTASQIHVASADAATATTNALVQRKLDAAGTTLWQRNSAAAPAGTSALLRAVVTDAQAQPLVIATHADPATPWLLKYSASGAALWSTPSPTPEAGLAQRMQRPSVGDSRYSADRRALQVDANGDSLVSGYSWNGASWDCELNRYDANGQHRWRYRQSHRAVEAETDCAVLAFAIAADGDVFIASVALEANTSATGFESRPYLARFSREGIQRWRQPLPAPASARLLAVDPMGGIVVGDGSGLSRFSADGTVRWQVSQRASALDVASDGSVFVVEATAMMMTIPGAGLQLMPGLQTRRLSATSGLPMWTASYFPDPAAPALVVPTAIVVDAQGQASVAGLRTMGNDGPASQTVLLNYDGNANERWRTIWKGPNQAGSQVQDLRVDGQGRLGLVAGTDNQRFATAHFDAHGIEMWSQLHGDGGAAWPNALALDAAGNTYVSGSQNSKAGDAGFLTIKYAPDGSLQWLHRHDGERGRDDFAYSVATLPGGGVVVAGSEDSDTGSDRISLLHLVDAPRPDAIFAHEFDSGTMPSPDATP